MFACSRRRVDVDSRGEKRSVVVTGDLGYGCLQAAETYTNMKRVCLSTANSASRGRRCSGSVDKAVVHLADSFDSKYNCLFRTRHPTKLRRIHYVTPATSADPCRASPGALRVLSPGM